MNFEEIKKGDSNRDVPATINEKNNVSENTIEAADFPDFSQYSSEVQNYLKNAPREIIEIIKNKKYYHVTSKKFAEAISKEGLRRNAEIISDDDVKYFKELFKRFGNVEGWFIVDNMISGRDNVGDYKPVHVSDYPMEKHYPFSERLQLFIKNLNYLRNAKFLSAQDREKCEELFKKYTDCLSVDRSVILEIDATCPEILNKILGAYDLESVDNDIIVYCFTKQNNPNISINNDIPNKYIRIFKEIKMDLGYFDISLVDKKDPFIVFPKE